MLERPELDGRERSLDPRVVNVWRVMTALSLAFPILIGTGVATAMLGPRGLAFLLLGIILVGLLAGWYPKARYIRWRWRLAPLALELRYGVLVHRHEAVPYFRIQQIDVNQGPLDRLLDLATVQVTTASASGSASLPGIPAAEAPTVRAELLVRAAAAVAEHQGEISDAV